MNTQPVTNAITKSTQSAPALRDRILSSRVVTSAQALSPWTRSAAKRAFDCASVLLSAPLLIPIFACVALAVRLTSRGPVLFRQQRMGRMGSSFTILKFRTMLHSNERVHRAVATVGNQNFTPIGRFLRRWKLDELPQLLNVLFGQMSLVGPRPKMLEHSRAVLHCRPGITGAATIAFAREEVLLNRVPRAQVDSLYHAVVLPAKQCLDNEYMARATFLTDMQMLVNTVLRRWDSYYLESLIAGVTRQLPHRLHVDNRSNTAFHGRHNVEPRITDPPAPVVEQVSSF